MNWELAFALVASCSSIFAIKVALSSKKQAKASADESLKIQKRMEINQFYPIIELIPSLDNDKVKLTIRNRSDQNKAFEFLIKHSLRIVAKDVTVDTSGESKFGGLQPNEVVEIFPDSVNAYFVDLPFLRRSNEEEIQVRIQFWVQFKAAHPESLPMSETTLFRIEKKKNKFSLIEEHV